MRTFIAIPLPAGAHALLETLQTQLRTAAADVRWTAVPSIHVTLKFLGEVDPPVVGKIADRLQVAGAVRKRFSLTLGGLGAFPGLRNPKVVWCGVRGDIGELDALYQAVETTCAEFGFPRESRAFQPHLTLGRIRSGRNLHQLADCIRIGSDLGSSFVVERFNVYRSTLAPQGAVHNIVASIEIPA